MNCECGREASDVSREARMVSCEEVRRLEGEASVGRGELVRGEEQ